ncbi:MAG: hypothetical protein ACKPA8_01515, partial [Dolichospermum sp.]
MRKAIAKRCCEQFAEFPFSCVSLTTIKCDSEVLTCQFASCGLSAIPRSRFAIAQNPLSCASLTV